MAKSKGGRPSKYNAEIQKKVDKYIEYFNESGIPYCEELAIILDVDEDTITNWTKQHDQFFRAIKKLKTIQKLRLLGKTMEKETCTGAIFQLKCNHGMIESHRLVSEGKLNITNDLSGHSDEDIDKLIVEEAKKIKDGS